MRKFHIVTFILLFSSISMADSLMALWYSRATTQSNIWTPAEIATTAWYDAADTSINSIIQSGGLVHTWKDKSGNDNHLIQTNLPNQLATGTRSIWSLNALEGTDLSEMKTTTDIAPATFTAIAYVAEYDDSGDHAIVGRSGTNIRFGRFVNQFRYRFLDNVLQSISVNTPSSYPYKSVEVLWIHSGTNKYITVNGGTPYSSGSAGPSIISFNAIPCNAFSSGFDGSIGEVIVYKGSSFDESLRQKIEGYLAWKWGMQGDLPSDHPYKNSEPTTAEPWTPADISTVAWYDASDYSTITAQAGLVSQWSDKSGNGEHVMQNIATLQPTYANDTLSFDGVDDYLGNTMPFMWSSGQIDIYIVAAGQNTTFSRLLGEGSSINANPIYTLMQSSTLATYSLGGFMRDDANSTFLISTVGNTDYALDNVKKIIFARDTGSAYGTSINGGTITSGAYDRTGRTLTLNRFSIGALLFGSTIRAMDADINEMVLTSNLSDDDRQKMEGYLAWKWGLQSNLPSDHPYKNSAPNK